MSREREEFSRKVMVAAFERASGKCEYQDLVAGDGRCWKVLRPGDTHYDHVIPWAISRDSSLGNCQCLCKAHHLLKTTKADVPTIAKTKRVEANHIGAKKPKSRGFRRPANMVYDWSTGRYVRISDGHDRAAQEAIEGDQS